MICKTPLLIEELDKGVNREALVSQSTPKDILPIAYATGLDQFIG
jgi:hypothetical protein